MNKVCEVLYMNKKGMMASHLCKILVKEKMEGRLVTRMILTTNTIASVLAELKRMGLVSQGKTRGFWVIQIEEIEENGNVGA